MIDHSRLEAVILESGRIAHSLWPGIGYSLKSWAKESGDLVCEADLAVDAFLKRELTALLPSAGWLSEETADDLDRLERDLIWVVDPIDGTRDFVRGREGWCVSVALVSAGKPLIGMLCVPAKKELWVAICGEGSWVNGIRLKASQRADFSGARIPVDALPSKDSDLVKVDKPNSIALRIAMIGADQADLIATLRWGYEWDIAAATLIAREAGAEVTDAFGKPLAFNKRDPRAFGVLVSAQKIHRHAVERLAERAARLAKEYKTR